MSYNGRHIDARPGEHIFVHRHDCDSSGSFWDDLLGNLLGLAIGCAIIYYVFAYYWWIAIPVCLLLGGSSKK